MSSADLCGMKINYLLNFSTKWQKASHNDVILMGLDSQSANIYCPDTIGLRIKDFRKISNLLGRMWQEAQQIYKMLIKHGDSSDSSKMP